MKKTAVSLLFFCVLSNYVFSQATNNERITIEITNVLVNGGMVYLAIFSNAQNYRNETPDIVIGIEANNTILTKEVSLSYGEYVISAYQDANNNQMIDYNLLGIPKERIAITNYSGKGYPTKNFDRQKIPVNSLTGKISIGLYQL